MKMKKITIASVAIGTMLSMTACSGTSTEKDQVKQEQTNVQEDAKTASADATTTTKETETSTSSNEKTEKDQKTKETNTSDQTTSGKPTEKEASTKSADQTTNGKTTTKGTKQGVTVKTNVKEVVQLVESLDKHLAANPKLDTVNKLGKQINEKWDVVEKELEASHPTDYKTIGQSIYPLIVGAEKQKIDIAKMKSLTTKTKKDLSQLLTKLS
ncbi:MULTISPECIES: hypothetical protein [unclassified Bacillus cereus group]|uniref:hypothetical protein n=1 Tax=unclassified Bacillus cereus group TaxID=2750818 RepID=UPI001F5AC8BA|nr:MULTISPECIES: hypothetical protein [unclassified Bacillus cereus group]